MDISPTLIITFRKQIWKVVLNDIGNPQKVVINSVFDFQKLHIDIDTIERKYIAHSSLDFK